MNKKMNLLLAAIVAVAAACSGEPGAAGKNGKDGADGTGTNGTNGTNGDNGLTSLVSTSEATDECGLGGGVLVHTGIDDNGNGTLDESEIDNTTPVCNGTSTTDALPIDPPAAPAGAYTMNLSGGNGGTGVGGDADNFYAGMDYGSLRGHLKVFNTGVVDASFTYPSTISHDFGAESFVVTANTTVVSLPNGDHTGLSAGDHFINNDTDRLLRWDGTNEFEVTGVDVQAGATLTLQAFGTDTDITFRVSSDVRNAGTITTATLGDGVSHPGFQIFCATFEGVAGSLLDNAGEAGSGDAGPIHIEAFLNVDGPQQEFGGLFNAGDVNASGGDGAERGDGAHVFFYSENVLMNTGDVDASGGTANDGNGGRGGGITFETNYGNNFNSGALTVAGGTGTSRGGDGGTDAYDGYGVALKVDGVGNLRNSGDIDVSGADGLDGGTGSYILFEAYVGEILSSGDLDLSGGDGTDGDGGNAHYLQISGYSDSDGFAGTSYNPTRGVKISGNIDLHGGNGTGQGGSGSSITVNQDAEYSNGLDPEVIFFGYTDIVAKGGNGTAGGAGGGFELYQDYSYDDVGYYGPSGMLINYANFDGSGGNGTSDAGGDAGGFEMYTDDYYQWAAGENQQRVLNFGNVTLNGGNGVTGGGDGGGVFLYGGNGVENHGDISANGGNATGDNAFGGDGAVAYTENILFEADDGACINTGDITARGGNSTGTNGVAGDGAILAANGQSLSFSGAIDVDGGDGDGLGGEGGDLFFVSTYETSSVTSTITAEGGTGDTAGDDGAVRVDGQNVSANF